MSQNQDDFDEIPSIVPERDELVSHRKRKRGTSANGGMPPRQESVESGTSGWVIFFITILCLGLMGTGGVGYYFYKQDMAAQEELLDGALCMRTGAGTMRGVLINFWRSGA